MEDLGFDASAHRGRRCGEFSCFLKTVLLSLSSACFCVSDAPVKAQHFVPQTNMSTDESQNNIHTNKFYICKWCCQHSVSQGFQRYFFITKGNTCGGVSRDDAWICSWLNRENRKTSHSVVSYRAEWWCSGGRRSSVWIQMFLCGVSMFSPCSCGFSLDMPASSHHPKTCFGG